MNDLFGQPVFGVTDPPTKLSATQRRTWNAKRAIELGRHPFGPELKNNGKTCGDCRFEYGFRGNVKIYHKCEKKGEPSGPATDLRLKWPACTYFEPKGEPREKR